jgi:hypothetical protein
VGPAGRAESVRIENLDVNGMGRFMRAEE